MILNFFNYSSYDARGYFYQLGRWSQIVGNVRQIKY